MTDSPTITVSAEEYRQLLIARIERCLKDADLPEDIVKGVLEASNALLPAGGESVTIRPRPRVTDFYPPRPSVPSLSGKKVDQRNKPHWPSPEAKKVEKPSSVSDLVLNALFSKCMAAPEIAKTIRKPRRAVYNAIWRLRNEGLIDQGPIPQD